MDLRHPVGVWRQHIDSAHDIWMSHVAHMNEARQHSNPIVYEGLHTTLIRPETITRDISFSMLECDSGRINIIRSTLIRPETRGFVISHINQMWYHIDVPNVISHWSTWHHITLINVILRWYSQYYVTLISTTWHRIDHCDIDQCRCDSTHWFDPTVSDVILHSQWQKRERLIPSLSLSLVPPPSLSPSLSMSLCFSLLFCLFLSYSLAVCLPPPFSLSLSLSLSLALSLSLSVSLSLFLSFSRSFVLSFSLCLSASLSPAFCFSLSLWLIKIAFVTP